MFSSSLLKLKKCGFSCGRLLVQIAFDPLGSGAIWGVDLGKLTHAYTTPSIGYLWGGATHTLLLLLCPAPAPAPAKEITTSEGVKIFVKVLFMYLRKKQFKRRPINICTLLLSWLLTDKIKH